MNNKLKFFITDVFAEKKYSGNQLATFLDSASLSEEEMQQIARETNFSETTFILSDKEREGGYDVRIFTPGEEVDFAGHPTLGTAFIIQKFIIQKPVEKVILNLKVGQIPVQLPAEGGGDRILWMKQKEPLFGEVMDVGFISRMLGINEGDIDSRFPIEAVSTGLPFLIVPLKNMDTLKRSSTVKELYKEFIKDSWAKAILVFCPGGYTDEQDLGVRVFVDCFGIPEDPATGSGNGCLAGYLVKHRYFDSKEIDIRAGQGYEIERPSLLFLKAKELDSGIHISIGGQVIYIAEGYWGVG